MNKYIFLGLIFIGLSCHKDNKLVKEYPSFKGYWEIKNDYPFWNPSHTRQTGCLDEPATNFLFFDSLSLTKYVIYKGGFAPCNGCYFVNYYAKMSYDTLTDSIHIEYKNTPLFPNYYVMNMKYEKSLKEIKGFIGTLSEWDCINLPGDSFQGNTVWIKVQ